MGEVIQMALESGDAGLWDVDAMLKDSLDIVASGEMKCNKAIVLFLDDETKGCYDAHYQQAGMKTSEIISLLEYMKHHLLNHMQGMLEED